MVLIKKLLPWTATIILLTLTACEVPEREFEEDDSLGNVPQMGQL